MKIEIGKTYELNPVDKKSVVEVEHWHSAEHGDIDITILWRWGTWYVTPQDKDEVKLLKLAMKENIELLVTDFKDYEMRECFDGCSEDLEYDGDWTEEQFESLKEEYWEDRWGTLEKYGYDQDGSDCYVHAAITLEEVKQKDADVTE